jgi:CRP/FNR family transcriptional regulator, anaerobic regulatory protein
MLQVHIAADTMPRTDTFPSPHRPEPTAASVASAAPGLVLLRALATPRTDALGVALPTPAHLRVAAGHALLHEGAVADHVYLVQAGTFKSVKTAEDGYDHVLGFALRGDLLGFDGLAAGHYASAALALEDSLVVSLPLSLLDSLRRNDAALDHAVQALLSRQLAHAVELAELMSAVAAEARLARFVLHLSSRMAEQGLSPRRLLLRMNRRDIASHLGLAHETVSRSFRLLCTHGCLRVENREVEILDVDGLRAHAHSTRGVADEAMTEAQHAVRAAQDWARRATGMPN